AVTATTLERIWFRAPDSLRIERTITFEGGTSNELVIERPGVRYTRRDGNAQIETGIAPSPAILPEPLSVTIALYGTDLGPGPVVAGRATRRFQLDVETERRIVTVDATTFSALGAEESTVLNKATLRFGR